MGCPLPSGDARRSDRGPDHGRVQPLDGQQLQPISAAGRCARAGRPFGLDRRARDTARRCAQGPHSAPPTTRAVLAHSRSELTEVAEYRAMEQFLLTMAVLIIAITIHEFSHALAADRLGDDTPR